MWIFTFLKNYDLLIAFGLKNFVSKGQKVPFRLKVGGL